MILSLKAAKCKGNADKFGFAGESLRCCGAQALTYLKYARALRSSRLALHPAKRISQRFLSFATSHCIPFPRFATPRFFN
jgi:hypothetical protein